MPDGAVGAAGHETAAVEVVEDGIAVAGGRTREVEATVVSTASAGVVGREGARRAGHEPRAADASVVQRFLRFDDGDPVWGPGFGAGRAAFCVRMGTMPMRRGRDAHATVCVVHGVPPSGDRVPL